MKLNGYNRENEDDTTLTSNWRQKVNGSWMKGRKEKAKMREERICRRILIANRLESRRRDERGEKDGKRERENILQDRLPNEAAEDRGRCIHILRERRIASRVVWVREWSDGQDGERTEKQKWEKLEGNDVARRNWNKLKLYGNFREFQKNRYFFRNFRS